ncbi:hypothetical protein IPM65_01435 [Candidatus Roizmanbacteria bacterium]|nr:MAG: hypothetical protein IPM65_01435 [Candidatus Roizmanbacteria bacterium]
MSQNNPENRQGLSRRQFLTAAGLGAGGLYLWANGVPGDQVFASGLAQGANGTIPPVPPLENPVYLPWVTKNGRPGDLEIIPPVEAVHDFSMAAESLYPFLCPTPRRRLFSSQRAQVVGVRNWDNTGGIPKVAVASAMQGEVQSAQAVEVLNAATAVGANKPHYYLDSEGKVQEVLPEEIVVNGKKKVMRKVAGMPGGCEITSMQFTMYPQETEFPAGFSFFIRTADGEMTEIPLREFFKNQTAISAPRPYIDPPENAQDAQSFIANIPFISSQGMEIFLSDNFFTDNRHFWYNFQMSERSVSEIEAVTTSSELFSTLSNLAEQARHNQDYSQLFADMLEAHKGVEEVGKHTEKKDRNGKFVQTVEAGRTASSFGCIVEGGEEYQLGASTVVLEFDDGEVQEFPAADFFMMESGRINHANVYFQTAAYGNSSKRFFSLNVPMAGVRKVELRAPDNFKYSSQMTTVNTDALPEYLKDKRIHFDVDTYKTSGGGDDMKLSSPMMDTVCSTVHLDGIRKRQEWPYYYMEQGQSYYRKVRQSDGTIRYMQDGSWSGGEDPWGAFYSGYHPINGGLIKLEEQYLGMDMFRNSGTYWLGLPFEQHMLGVIPDTGQDNHFLELNLFSGRKRYEGLEGKIVKMGYRGNRPLAEHAPSEFAGDHYLAYEIDENMKAGVGGPVYADIAHKALIIERSLVTREYPGNEHKPVSVPSFWRSVQAVVEYYRYIKDTPHAQNGEVADLIYRDFMANSRPVLRITNYGESGYDHTEIMNFFQQENEQAALQVFLDAFLQKLGIHS